MASAVAALSSFWWQRRAALEAASPELVLEEFSTADEGGTRYVRAERVRNVGSGVANAIYGTVRKAADDPFLPVGGGQLVSVLSPQGTASIKFEIIMEEPELVDGLKVGSVSAVIVCWDIRGWRHDFVYTFLVSPAEIGMTDPVAQGLMVSSRFHTRRSPLRQTFEHRLPTFSRLLPFPR